MAGYFSRNTKCGMNVKIRPGFIVYESGEGPVYVCPHSGGALEVPTSRDDNSETVASICWLRTGGTLIVSTLPRKPMFGIDYNRDAPPKTLSLKMWDSFIRGENNEELEKYRNNYAWVSGSAADHAVRLRIYRDFWKTVGSYGKTVLFMHRKFTRMKNYPSIIEVMTADGWGANRNIMRNIISAVNRKYAAFFREIAPNYRKAILLEHERVADRIKEMFGAFDLKKMMAEYRNNTVRDVEVITKYASNKTAIRLERSFTEKNFNAALKSALSANIQPRVTLEAIFSGDKALGSKRPLSKIRNVLEIECNTFISYWYPGMASDIIIDMIKEIRSFTKLPMYFNGEKNGNKRLQAV
jgi:hypothetical protein